MRELTLAQLDKLTRQYVLADGTWARTKFGRGGRRNRARKRRAFPKLDALLGYDFRLDSDPACVQQAIYRRLLTSGDNMFSGPDYGLDLASTFSNIAPPQPITLERIERAIGELGKFQVPVSLAVGTGLWDAFCKLVDARVASALVGITIEHAPQLERNMAIPLGASGFPIMRPRQP